MTVGGDLLCQMVVGTAGPGRLRIPRGGDLLLHCVQWPGPQAFSSVLPVRPRPPVQGLDVLGCLQQA
eukprot:NODE_1376_length_1447_cov_12.019313_g1144_i0.p8 GENE.NODE_1376_length_1447_cov_12.019313_g1144_i0~~NODE_1376_length_1447_cov_12.019313_g1144_i0.p8  ORF type:complete len:67 (+),score=0.84 NODE_1376_length_1447_cov_12.019313_g1144_i0:757-957(+)